MLKIVDCPRDAMQGLKKIIPTDVKIAYLQDLLLVNFNVLDCGSFVSPKAIPQMADSAEVISSLDLSDTRTKISVVVANECGAENALKVNNIHYLGFPLSISQKFQQYNANCSCEEGLQRIKNIFDLTQGTNKELAVYLSMGFGNPYGEFWDKDLVFSYVEKVLEIGITKINLSDTVGTAVPEDISAIFSFLNKKYPNIQFSAHFHTIYNEWYTKISAAYAAGCRSFDGAIQGYGGCPLSGVSLLGNMPTEKLISFANAEKEKIQINPLAFEHAFNNALTLFGE